MSATLPFRWASFDAYLFDIDGTLLNSRDGVHYNAFHAALEDVFGVQDRIETVQVHGNTDPGILQAVARNAGVPDEVFRARLPLALSRMRAAALAHAKEMRPEVCRGVREALGRLRAYEKLMGIVSGNLEDIGWAKLRAAGLREFFTFGSFSDERLLRAEIFDYGMEQVRQRLGARAGICVVGDTPFDISAARQCGISVIAVASGIYNLEQLREHAPDVCVTCCGDLLGS